MPIPYLKHPLKITPRISVCAAGITGTYWIIARIKSAYWTFSFDLFGLKLEGHLNLILNTALLDRKCCFVIKYLIKQCKAAMIQYKFSWMRDLGYNVV